MSYQVLARKWRPRTFAELVGQEHVVRALTNALTTQRLHHAYLLTGTRGVGKTTLARILAKALNCETGITATPCGACGACTEIDSGRFVDLVEVDAATNTGVDEMRQLLDQAQYMPVSGRFKVYIIDEVHMLSRGAFNSMLKTLEEPPEHVKFVLATTDPQKVPVTVLSRCLQFNLKQMPPEAISTHLAVVLEREGIGAEQAALDLLARAAQGSMRDALSLLDQAIAYGAGRVETAHVKAMLGAIDDDHLFNLLDCVARGDGNELVAEADRMAQRAFSFEDALVELGVLLHRVALVQTVPGALPDTTPAHERIVQLAQAFSPEAVQLYYQIALNGRRDLPWAPDEYAGFTMTLMRMLAFASEDANVPALPQAQPAGANMPARAVAAPVPKKYGEPPPAPPNENRATEVAPRFDGDWTALVAKLNAGGMAHMLARHCELQSFDETTLQLVVPAEHRHLLDKSYQDKLRSAVEAQLGSAIRLRISVGEASGSSLAAIEDREQRERQARAIAAIEKDPFVRGLVDDLDAKLIESSIKPIESRS